MYLRKVADKRTKKTYLSIAHTYRGENGKPKIKTIMSLGNLEELRKQYHDPIEHFTKIAEQMEAERIATQSVKITLNLEEQLPRGEALRKNIGYVLLSKIYHELETDRFLDNARRREKHRFNTEAMMRLLLYSRLLEPASKRASFINKDYFFDKFDFDLPDVYSALTHYDKLADALQQHLHEQVVRQYNRDTKLVYYDVTNYYYESERQDGLRRKGCGKQGKRTPLVQMGLLMDRESLPIMYKVFPGNTHDSQTMMPMLAQVKRKFNTRRIVAVADKGLNSGDNIVFNTALGDGYIFSKSVRGASEEFKTWILDLNGYKEHGAGYRCKSVVVPDARVSMNVDKSNGRAVKKTVRVEQKWVAFYSEKYAKRAKHKRDEVIAKAMDMINKPYKYRGVLDYGAAGYIQNIKVDKDSGRILETKDVMRLDVERIADEEKLDGYYALITSELDDTDEQIINAYHGLWRIEESFKITKSVLGTRPIYLHTPEHVNAHMLICFLALLIGRIIERRLGGMYTFEQIIETLRKIECSHLSANIWLCDYATDFTDVLNRTFGTEFGRKHVTLAQIKNFLAQSKKIVP